MANFPPAWVARVPLSLFALPLGLAATAKLWREAAPMMGLPLLAGETLGAAAAFLLSVVLMIWGLKLVLAPAAALAEWHDLARAPMAAAAPLALMAVAGLLAAHSLLVARILWVIAGLALLSLAVALMGRLLRERPHVVILGPAWFMPFAGMMMAPAAGLALGLEGPAMALFGAGAVTTLWLGPVILFRLVFAEPLGPPQAPLLAILLAPPALAVQGLIALADGDIGYAAEGILLAAFFIFLVLLTQWARFRRAPFSLAHWAFVFPVSSLAAAALQYLDALGANSPPEAAWLVLALANLLFLLVAGRTLWAMAAGRLFPPGP